MQACVARLQELGGYRVEPFRLVEERVTFPLPAGPAGRGARARRGPGPGRRGRAAGPGRGRHADSRASCSRRTWRRCCMDERRRHRTGMLEAYAAAARALEAERPAAIVALSARWEAPGPFLVDAARRHATLTDYYGFGVEVRYDCHGEPKLAQAIVAAAQAAGVRAADDDARRGQRRVRAAALPRRERLYPVVPVSLGRGPPRRTAPGARRCGRSIDAVPDRVAFVVGGMLSHNVHAWSLRRETPEAQDFDRPRAGGARRRGVGRAGAAGDAPSRAGLPGGEPHAPRGAARPARRRPAGPAAVLRARARRGRGAGGVPGRRAGAAARAGGGGAGGEARPAAARAGAPRAPAAGPAGAPADEARGGAASGRPQPKPGTGPRVRPGARPGTGPGGRPARGRARDRAGDRARAGRATGHGPGATGTRPAGDEHGPGGRPGTGPGAADRARDRAATGHGPGARPSSDRAGDRPGPGGRRHGAGRATARAGRATGHASGGRPARDRARPGTAGWATGTGPGATGHAPSAAQGAATRARAAAGTTADAGIDDARPAGQRLPLPARRGRAHLLRRVALARRRRPRGRAPGDPRPAQPAQPDRGALRARGRLRRRRVPACASSPYCRARCGRRRRRARPPTWRASSGRTSRTCTRPAAT